MTESMPEFEVDMRLAVLRDAGVVKVVLPYDGSGDSGDWNEMYVEYAECETPGRKTAQVREWSVPDDLVNEFHTRLEHLLPNFNGEGGYGQFLIDTETGNIQHDQFVRTVQHKETWLKLAHTGVAHIPKPKEGDNGTV